MQGSLFQSRSAEKQLKVHPELPRIHVPFAIHGSEVFLTRSDRAATELRGVRGVPLVLGSLLGRSHRLNSLWRHQIDEIRAAKRINRAPLAFAWRARNGWSDILPENDLERMISTETRRR